MPRQAPRCPGVVNLVYHGAMTTLRKILKPLIAGGCLLLATACGDSNEELRILPLVYQALDPERMEAVFAERSRLRMQLARPTPGLSALEALLSDQADLTLIENSTPFEPGVRAVLPAYESVLHLLIREGFDFEPSQQPLLDAEVFLANSSNAEQTFLTLAAERQGVAADALNIVDNIDQDTDIIVYFGPIDPYRTRWYREGFRLVSLESDAAHGEDHLSGIGYLVPRMQPARIPANTYKLPGNEGPIATLQVDMLLVARKQVPETQIYELTRTLIEEKQRFTAIAPAVFSGLNETFDPLDLNFPLHPGARRFLERDEPSLLERYAETINMLVYISVLLLTGLAAAARWRARRKKDRADVFYTQVLAVRERARDGERDGLLSELDKLEREAFQMLIDEKLSADESFRIFTDLLERTRADLRQ